MLGALITELREKTRLPGYFTTPPRFEERPTNKLCPQCSQKLRVYKTKHRNAHTLRYGLIKIRITVLMCDHGHQRAILEPERLHQLVPKYATLGIDVTVWIGLQRFREGRRIADIQEELRNQGIHVCENTVVNHSIRFLAYFLCVHRESAPLLNERFQKNGGYILQFDSSSEESSQKFLLFLEGMTGILLDAVTSPAADYDHYRPVLKRIKTSYGNPLQIVSDLGKAEAKVARLLFPSVLHRLCHYHFLRTVGEVILESAYDRFRTLMKEKGKKLRALRKSIHKMVEEATGGFRTDLTKEPLVEVFLFLERLFSPKGLSSGLGFPFDLRAVDTYARYISVAELVRTSVQLNAELLVVNRPLLRLDRLLNELLANTELKALYALLHGLNEPFLALREMFHLKPQKVPLSDTHGLCWSAFRDLRMAAMRLIKRFRQSLSTVPSAHRVAYQTIIAYLRKYWTQLFCHGVLVPDDSRTGSSDSAFLLPRTNNAVEHTYREVKRFIRRLCGKKQIGSELDRLGKGVALVSNLSISLYVEAVYGSLEIVSFCGRFSRIPHPTVQKVEHELLAELRGLGRYRLTVEQYQPMFSQLKVDKRAINPQRECCSVEPSITEIADVVPCPSC